MFLFRPWSKGFSSVCMAAWAALWMAFSAVTLAGEGLAQGAPGIGKSAASQSSPPPAASPTLTFQLLKQAIQLHDHTIVQLRRFRDELGNVVAVRECLRVDADGSDSPPHSLTFVGVDAQLPGSALFQKWQQIYVRFGALFYQYSTFRVRDLGKAQANYTLHHFGSVMRANRTAYRLVVFPQSLDKAILLIDVDMQTLVPLYTAEFDTQLRLLSEVEAESFSTSVQMAAAASSSTGILQADFASAKAFLGDPHGLIDPIVSFASDYGLERIEVRDDPLNGLQKLVMTYTDGVDQFMVEQTPGLADVFAGLPSNKGVTQGTNITIGNTIARYRDPAMSVLLFWDDGVAFQVAGRGSMQRLDELARRLYLQALSTN